MPYDTIVWGEVTQNSGLAGVAALAGQTPFKNSGDTLKMPRRKIITGLCGTSLTKPNGGAVYGDKSRGGKKFVFNTPISQGVGQLLRDIALPFEDQESITAELSNTNVSEESQVAADIVDPSEAHEYPKTLWESARKAGIKPGAIHSLQASVTVAATKTIGSGEVDLETAINAGIAGQSPGWLSSEKNYKILGLMHSIATTAFGIVHIRGLAGEWEKRQPGIPMYGKLLGTFDNPISPFVPAYEPIPFKGSSLPLISETGLVAAAHTFGVVIGEV